jgi:coenzyme Q-binding protein COQ10
MKSSKQEIIINHRAKDLYKIVLDIEKYSEYIPWCKKIIIKTRSKNEMLADMIVCYRYFLPQTFTSHVMFDSNKLLINTNYIKGPLKDLRTEWLFKKLEIKKTKIIFTIKFEFQRLLHQKMAELFFGLIENKMIDSFKKRADEILD